MGLDQSIYRKQKLSDNHDEIMKCISEDKPEPRCEYTYKETEVLYLRKVNQIHKYFVDNFAEGNDDCNPIYVNLEVLKKLRDICKKIIKASVLRPAILEGGYGFVNFDKNKKVRLGKPLYNEVVFQPLDEKTFEELKTGDFYISENSLHQVKSRNDKGDKVQIEYTELYIGKEIEDSSLAKELLPTQEGFFFGSYSYDEWYLDGLKSYVSQVDELVKEHKALIESGVEGWDIDYYYQASW